MQTNYSIKKITITVLITGLILLGFSFELGQYLNLEFIQARQIQFTLYYQNNPLLTPFVFFVLYLMVAALSLPFAAILTLLAGALFGLGFGVLLVSFASTLGATCAFVISRFLIKDYVQNKFKNQLNRINHGFRKEGLFYLFALRLVPIFPFFLINLATALLPIRLWSFYWVSQIAMLPATVILVYAGQSLTEISSLANIMSTNVIIAFSLLGIFPIAAKKILTMIRNNNKAIKNG